MNALKPTSTTLLATCTLAGFALWSAPTWAARNHVFSKAIASQGSGVGQLSQPAGVAVNEATGNVYVVDEGNNRVEYFGSSGVYVGEFNGSASPTGHFSSPKYIAIDSDPSSPSFGDVYVVDTGHRVIDKFSSTGAYVGQLTGTSGGAKFQEIIGIAVDASGRLWVEDGTTIDGFSAAVANEFVSSRSGQEFAGGYPWFAVDSNDNFYVKTYFRGISELNTAGEVLVTEFDSLLPQEYFSSEVPTGMAVEVPSNDVYIDDADGEGAIGQLSPSGAVVAKFGYEHLGRGSGVAVDSKTGEVFVADSTAGTIDAFILEPPAKPTVEAETVSNVSATSATLEGELNPRGGSTEYHFEYGLCATPTTCASSPYNQSAPNPENPVGSEFVVVPLEVHVQGLLGGMVYHFRVVAHNKYGTVLGAERTFTTQPAAASELPDGRHWEMVSPPDKKGARIAPISEIGVVQAAASGNAIAYLTDGPTEAEPQGNTNQMQVLSTRGPGGWGSRDMALPHSSATGKSIGEGEEYRFFSEDLSLGIVQPFGDFVPGLSVEASEPTAFLRTLDAACSSSCYRPLVTGKVGYANVLPPGTVFGGAPEGKCSRLYCGPEFVDATPDLRHVVLSSGVALTPGAGSDQLYEWSGGELTPIGVLPGGAPVENPQLGGGNGGGAFNSRGAISHDGSRVIWTARSLAQLYMRDLGQKQTVQLDVAEPGCVAEGKCESGAGEFQLASADGSEVFFTDMRRLTKNAGFSGKDLYECEMIEKAGELECKLSDLGGVVGVLGASEDGSYLYFVSNDVLAEGAVPGGCVGEVGGTGRTCNLYVRHGGATRPVAVLSAEDRHDWWSDPSGLSARVSPSGNWVEFMSQRSLTGYDNRDAVNGRPDAEVYLYNASTGRVVCASCDPTGARPVGREYHQLEPGSGGLVGGPRGVWESQAWVAANVPGWIQYKLGRSAYQPRYLSDSGRLFFNSSDALVPQDVNGTEDVYEYEPPGVGGCSVASVTFSEQSGGCVGLISSGTSAEESGFLDASETGGDVFFLTFSKLAPQDYDNSLDVYDAHECTSTSPCFSTPVPQLPACTTAEACRAAPTPQPAVFGAPSSATFSGAGNIVPVSSSGSVTGKGLTEARKLASALNACRRKPKRQRAVCERRARARYGSAKRGKAASRKGGKR